MMKQKEIREPVLRTAAIVLVAFVVAVLPVYSQVRSAMQRDSLATLRNESLRAEHPEKIIAAIHDLTAPFIAQPIHMAEPLPDEILLALADLLDFGQINKGDPMVRQYGRTDRVPGNEYSSSLRQRVLPTMVKVLEDDEMDSLKSKNALWVVRRIVGDDRETVNYLLSEYEKARTDKKKERILSAANRIEIIR